MREGLDRELNRVTEQTIRMITLVREMVDKSAKALAEQDPPAGPGSHHSGQRGRRTGAAD
ncbi:hypothetical protein [Candidatus Hakubella thermalkaliphila]|uniref:hypothetical protein n=1 Tax=Candidatus Hakubella thermalkaliphila TaxID=2754717 RepID=UPI001FE998CB|nr:hypothetical protein [Candidatus Hakubella thermalkaliphila]